MKRRTFNYLLSTGSAGLGFSSINACDFSTMKIKNDISLAQWSLNKMIRFSKTLNPLDFSLKAKELGFSAVEYVSGLYKNELSIMSFKDLTNELSNRSIDNNVKNVLIMVNNHKKWVEMAHELGCHSIRVNLYGESELNKWKDNSSEALTQLSQFASDSKINIIVENHGGLSSNAKELVEIIKNVNLNNCGTLPDFGNFCITRENLSLYDGPCALEYDKYKGVRELMPYAKAVSAKSYNFDSLGNETTIDYKKMLEIVWEFGYNGYLGIEYEGDVLTEIEGIKATNNLIVKLSS
jgi:sugar phosphate isomerase/epimerase